MIILDAFKTKQCPYCAEYIKAAARKCRYCLSDLPAEPDQLAPSTGDAKPDRAANAANDVETQDSPSVSQIADDSPPPVDAFVALARHMRRVWRGELALWQAFWLYTVLPGFLFTILMRGMTSAQIRTGQYLWASAALGILSVAYLIFAYVAVWRSALRYEGPRLVPLITFGYLAFQIYSLDAILISTLTYHLGMVRGSSDYLDMTAIQANESLPLRIDESTELYRVSAPTGRGEPTMTFHYRLSLPADTSQWGQRELNELMYSGIRAWACSNKSTVDFMKHGVGVTYTYEDATHVIGSLTVRPGDCEHGPWDEYRGTVAPPAAPAAQFDPTTAVEVVAPKPTGNVERDRFLGRVPEAGEPVPLEDIPPELRNGPVEAVDR